jgi:hypothetical protein
VVVPAGAGRRRVGVTARGRMGVGKQPVERCLASAVAKAMEDKCEAVVSKGIPSNPPSFGPTLYVSTYVSSCLRVQPDYRFGPPSALHAIGLASEAALQSFALQLRVAI